MRGSSEGETEECGADEVAAGWGLTWDKGDWLAGGTAT